MEEQFNYFNKENYTLEHWLHFLETGQIDFKTARECGMPIVNFDESTFMRLLKSVPFDEMARLVDFNTFKLTTLRSILNSGRASIGDLENYGLNETRKRSLERVNDKTAAEQRAWDNAQNQDTIGAYKEYLLDHGDGFQVGDEVFPSLHADDAHDRIREIEQRQQRYVRDVIDHMRENPWMYKNEQMRMLLEGTDESTRQRIKDAMRREPEQNTPLNRFLAQGFRMRIEDLWDSEVVPRTISKANLCAPDFDMPATNMSNITKFPNERGRTDIFFLGVPRSGKSSVLSALIYQLYNEGRTGYVPFFDDNGIDPCQRYYNALIRSMGAHKPPMGTPADQISFLQLNIPKRAPRNKEIHKVNIVEMAGEAFRAAAEANGGDAALAWKDLGAAKYMACNNRKVLFFVVDYSIICGKGNDFGGYENIRDTTGQGLLLEQCVDLFLTDGPDPRNRKKGCTFSKVDKVCIIVTKCDLMDKPKEEWLNESMRFIKDTYRSFIEKLRMACKEFNINKTQDFFPIPYPFSLGKFYPGNTVEFDKTSAVELIDNGLTAFTEYQKSSIFNDIFGGKKE